MARKEIKSPINDQTLNNTNHNFIELYDEFNKFSNTLSNIVDTVSDEAFNKVVDSARLNWKDPVDYVENLPSDASEGDTRMVRDNGGVYRYDGSEWKDIQEIDAGPVNELDSRLSKELNNKASAQYETLAVKVPSDYLNINAAIDELSERKTKRGVLIDIVLEEGYRITVPTSLSNGDYSHFRISSEDEEVFLSDNFPESNFMTFYNCRAPILNCLINANSKCIDGISVYHTSTIYIMPGCGLKGAKQNNLIARYASTAYANYGVFTGASQEREEDGGGGYAGITAWGSTVYAYGADVSDSKTYGVRAAHSGIIHFQNGTANDCGRHGIRASNAGILDARGAQANNCGVHGIYALAGSTINAYEAEAKNAGNSGVFANQASVIDARGVSVDGSKTGINAQQGSRINFFGGSADDCVDYAVYALHNSDVIARSITGNAVTGVYCDDGARVNTVLSAFNGCVSYGLIARNGGEITARNTAVTNTLSSGLGHGVQAERGGRIVIVSGRVANSSGTDLRVDKGGTIIANDCRTTSSTTDRPHADDINLPNFNTITTSLGIIWGNPAS